jgi:flotillin
MGDLFTIVIPAIVVALVLILLAIKKMVYICGPNEVLIFSGKRRRVSVQRVVKGKTVQDYKDLGYRTIKGGRGFRIPMLERVDRIDLTNMIIEVSIANAYSKGGIPLGIHGVANVKIAGEEPVIDNAIERFLGKPREEIIRIIRETLEGNLRGVLATLTPEEVNEKKDAFVSILQDEAIKDLQRLGVVVDTVKIQNVYDDVGYLNSIGRIRSADIKKAARISEAENKSLAAVRNAENKQETTLRQIEVEVRTVKAEAEKRIRDAISRRDAVVAEEKAKVEAAVAKSRAEIDMQEARLEQVKRRLEADVLQPARAQANADQAQAKGQVAQIIEEGRARAEAFRSIAESWKKAGVAAKDMLLLQKLDELLPQILRVCDDLKVSNLTVLPLGEGGSVARTAVSVNEQIKSATGVDLAAAAKRLTRSPTPKPPSPSPTGG